MAVEIDGPKIDGPRLEPRGGAAKRLVVFLHGYGADGNDLIEIGRAWQGLLPDTAFVSPHAPEPCGQAPMGRQWFPLTMRDPERALGAASTRQRRCWSNSSTPNWRGATCRPRRWRLVGFSQGTMMALHVGLRRAVPPAAIVGYSGLLVLPENAEPTVVAGEITSKPPVLLVHGDRDEMIPPQALFHAAQALAALDVPCEWHISPGIGHGIDQEGLRHGGEFLARRFGRQR